MLSFIWLHPFPYPTGLHSQLFISVMYPKPPWDPLSCWLPFLFTIHLQFPVWVILHLESFIHNSGCWTSLEKVIKLLLSNPLINLLQFPRTALPYWIPSSHAWVPVPIHSTNCWQILWVLFMDSLFYFRPLLPHLEN